MELQYKLLCCCVVVVVGGGGGVCHQFTTLSYWWSRCNRYYQHSIREVHYSRLAPGCCCVIVVVVVVVGGGGGVCHQFTTKGTYVGFSTKPTCHLLMR